MLLYYIHTFWENFHTELSTLMGKFSHRINNTVKSIGKFPQRILMKGMMKNRKLYLFIGSR